MKSIKPTVHFTDKYLLAPTNPITVNLIGAGGTGSQMLTALARMNHALIQLNHPGLFVKLFDDDIITEANMGRQLFALSELGQHKASALIARVNRFFGTNWKSVTERFDQRKLHNHSIFSNITISCVDTASSRFSIAAALKNFRSASFNRDRAFYWMDFGNAQSTGQVILSTVETVKQPSSKQFSTCAKLPWVTSEFKSILEATNDDETPSCSLAEALVKQDLFINTSLCALGASLLWSLFREGMIQHRGFFLNLKDFRSQPIPVGKVQRQP
jgi:PRTRC genetic system ThiF family protein